MYECISKHTKKYHVARHQLDHSSGYFLEYSFFRYEGARLTFYRSIGPSSKKNIGFCYEGKYDSSVVRKFMSKNELDKLNFVSDGIFYIVDDAGFVSARLFVGNHSISEIYLYVTFD